MHGLCPLFQIQGGKYTPKGTERGRKTAQSLTHVPAPCPDCYFLPIMPNSLEGQGRSMWVMLCGPFIRQDNQWAFGGAHWATFLGLQGSGGWTLLSRPTGLGLSLERATSPPYAMSGAILLGSRWEKMMWRHHLQGLEKIWDPLGIFRWKAGRRRHDQPVTLLYLSLSLMPWPLNQTELDTNIGTGVGKGERNTQWDPCPHLHLTQALRGNNSCSRSTAA